MHLYYAERELCKCVASVHWKTGSLRLAGTRDSEFLSVHLALIGTWLVDNVNHGLRRQLSRTLQGIKNLRRRGIKTLY